MAFLNDRRFSFHSQAMSEDTFDVVSFTGTEGLSQCYRFEILLVAGQPDLDLAAILKSPGALTIHGRAGSLPFHGVLAELEQLHAYRSYYFYRAVLVPKLWYLSLIHHSQAFLNKSLPDFFKDVLQNSGLTSLDYEFRFQHTYHPWEYVCQYQESHLDFLSRWMERDGVYYFFEQTPNGEKVIFTDSKAAHVPMPQGEALRFHPPSGLEETHREEVVRAWRCSQHLIPQGVLLKDYNYRTPSQEISGKANVSPENGRGQVYIYGDHFRAPQEGNNLARVRAEAMRCREQLFRGESTIPHVCSGYRFDLQDHFRSSFNQAYLTIQVTHEGDQSALYTSVYEGVLEGTPQEFYRNQFTAIAAPLQYRSEHKTPKPRIYGTLTAKVDAASPSGQYAELDEQGRYKVIMPFDLSGRSGGKASAFLRMAQPYAGSDHGMHFPLHKGTEVLLTFIDGDPDRPIIAAAVPNPETPSPVTTANQTTARITTGGQNKIHFEDKEDTRRILFQTPHANTWFRMGAPNDPPGNDHGGENPPTPEEEWAENYEKYENSTDPKTSGDPEWDEKYEAYEESPEPRTSGDPEWDALMHTQEDKEHWEEWTEEEKEKEKEEEAELHKNEEGFWMSSEGGFGGNFRGDWDVKIGGASFEVIAGSVTELIMGLESSTCLGLVNWNHIGGLIEIVTPFELGLFLGLKTEIQKGGLIEIGELHKLRHAKEEMSSARELISQRVGTSARTLTPGFATTEAGTIHLTGLVQMVATAPDMRILGATEVKIVTPLLTIDAPNIILNGNVVINGKATINGATTVNGATAVVGTLASTMNLSTNGNLTVAGTMQGQKLTTPSGVY